MHIYVDIVYDKCIYTYMHIDAYILYFMDIQI